jgi:hypothetical protein
MPNKTLKKRINNYVQRKGDVCCERDLDRDELIQEVFDLYLKIADFFGEKSDYLSYVTNDLVKLIGYRSDMEEAKNTEGVKLWNSINRSTKKKGKKNDDMVKISQFLKSVPLYYLLSVVGYAYNRFAQTKI